MISVIVPVYNAHKWLKRCLDSLVSQTIFARMELIIIDDGSTDKSSDIIASYISKFANITGKRIENGGVSNARNFGIEMASGDWITFVDADDYVDEDYIENLYRAIEDGIDIVCSGFVAEYLDRKAVRRSSLQERKLEKIEALSAFLNGGELEPNVTDKLFRRVLIGDTRFDVQCSIAEDKYFLFECLKKIRALIMIPYTNYHYVMNDSSACRKRFLPDKFQPVEIADRICIEIGKDYPQLRDLAETMKINVKCGVYGDMCKWNAQREYPEEYKRLRRDIRKVKVWNIAKYASKKHIFAILAAQVSPYFYNFLKHGLKLQYVSLFFKRN